MENSQCAQRVTSDRDIRVNSVLDGLTRGELEIVQKLCEATDAHDIFDSLNDEQNAAISESYMDSAEPTSDEFSGNVSSVHENFNNTYDDTTPIVSHDTELSSLSTHGVNNEILIEFTHATDLLSNNCLRTQLSSMRDASQKQRIEEIATDLMSYEQMKNTQVLDSSNLRLETIPGNATNIAIKVMETEERINENQIQNEDQPNDDFHIITSEYTANDTTGTMDYESSIANFDENLLDLNSHQRIGDTRKTMIRYEITGNNDIFEVHAVGVGDKHLPDIESDNRRNINEEINGTVTLRESQSNTPNAMEITANDRNVTENENNVPKKRKPTNNGDEDEISTTKTTTNKTRDIPKRHTRSSTRYQQSAGTSNSRERTLRTRYPDLNDLKMQAENNCPDLDNPFWENIESFSCKRSVFYRKRSNVICHLSFFKEVHEPMGFKIDSKHIMIKSNKDPQMPICILCHTSHYEVKEAVKCKFCVKAYFELMCESEQGDRRDIIDRWD
ncbi:hypothetical protein QAD02_012900 [Eretmocerus hayati]|uniref:Uncharacterized protein n=1 Tax=Eretmocerus hayati TaxID=131215 RepID=A0ACC2P1X6_9HYME|nr:hypothetical protein QAD02_012900 [Eretmocerus hayati]